MGRGAALLTGGRPREGVVLLRGAHQMAMAHDLEVEMNARILLAFYQQWGEPAAGLALGREGMEIARRRGSRPYGFLMVGNAMIVAFRVGEWDWAAATLDEWLAIEARTNSWTELYVDRAILRSLRGEDATADIEAAAALRSPATSRRWDCRSPPAPPSGPATPPTRAGFSTSFGTSRSGASPSTRIAPRWQPALPRSMGAAAKRSRATATPCAPTATSGWRSTRLRPWWTCSRSCRRRSGTRPTWWPPLPLRARHSIDCGPGHSWRASIRASAAAPCRPPDPRRPRPPRLRSEHPPQPRNPLEDEGTHRE